MHLFLFAFYGTAVIYAFFYNPVLIFYYLLFVGGYIIISIVYPGAKNISTRKKIMVAGWPPPSEGVIHVNVQVRVDNVLKVLQTLPKQSRPTMTHFVIKAAGQLIHEVPDMNGKLVFGKFVQYKTCDISCLVDIDGGKDLAMVLVKEVQKKSIQDITEFIREKGKKIKEGKGDVQHKKRTQSANFLPAFLVTLLLEAASFICCKLGLSIPAFALKKDQFGAGCVTSLGMLGFQNATAPFTGFMNCVFFVSANAVFEKPVIQDGQIVIGKVMNANFVVDHRYVDGGKVKTLTKVFKDVFINPQKYMNQHFKKKV